MADYLEFDSYFNGAWIPYRDVMISPDDRGFMLSDAVFDVARTFNGIPFRWADHVDRLFRSLKYLDLDPLMTKEKVVELGEEAVHRNVGYLGEVADFIISCFVTRGPGVEVMSESGPPNVCVNVKPINCVAFAPLFENGAHGAIARTRSYSVESMDSKLKHYSRLNFVLASIEAAQIDPFASPILLDVDGNVTEGNAFNVFVVTDGKIRTPKAISILEGVTREVVMELADAMGNSVIEDDLQPYDLYTADEVFFTRTTPRIIPVSKIDNRVIGDQLPGPVTEKLLAAHSDLVGVDIVDQIRKYARRQR